MNNTDPHLEILPVNIRIIEDRFFFKNTNQVYVRILLEDILWLKGKGNYTIIHTKYGNEIIRAYLGDFISATDNNFLVRVEIMIEEFRPHMRLYARIREKNSLI